MTAIVFKSGKKNILGLWAFYRPQGDLTIEATDFKFSMHRDSILKLYLPQVETRQTYCI